MSRFGGLVRLSAVLLLLSLAGIMAGTALISLQALGLGIVADSVAVGAFALLRDTGDRPAPSAEGAPTLYQVLERARAS